MASAAHSSPRTCSPRPFEDPMMFRPRSSGGELPAGGGIGGGGGDASSPPVLGGGGLSVSLSSPSSSSKHLKLRPNESLLSAPSLTGSGVSPSPGSSPSKGGAAAIAAEASPSFFARLLLKKGEKKDAESPKRGSVVNVPDSEDLDLPVRRYHSYSSMGIPDITGSGGSFTRRHGALGSPGCSIAGDKASLQGQTHEALQQLMRQSGSGSADESGSGSGSGSGSPARLLPSKSTNKSSRLQNALSNAARLHDAGLLVDEEEEDED